MSMVLMMIYADQRRNEVEKLLKVIKGREFPRSSMVWTAVLNKLNKNRSG